MLSAVVGAVLASLLLPLLLAAVVRSWCMCMEVYLTAFWQRSFEFPSLQLQVMLLPEVSFLLHDQGKGRVH